MRRLLKSATDHGGCEVLGSLSEWLVLGDFERSAVALAKVNAKRVRRLLRDLGQAVRGGKDAPNAPPNEVPEWFGGPNAAIDRPRAALAAIRLRVGELLERESSRLALLPEVSPQPRARPVSEEAQKRSARIFQDSLAAAVFCSAHVDFLDAMHCGFQEPPAPHLHSSPNAFCERDTSVFFDRRLCAPSLLPKGTSCMAALMQRSWAATSRGWDTALRNALRSCQGVRSICLHSLVCSVTGMHACVHPTLRPHWRRRLVSRRVLVSAFGSTSRAPTGPQSARTQVDEPLVACSDATREALRRALAQTLDAHSATRDAMLTHEPTVETLLLPPSHFPSRPLHDACAAFAAVCSQICQGMCPEQALRGAFNARDNANSNANRGTGRPARSSSYSIARAVLETSEDCFRAAFAPVWIACHARDIRVSKLGPTLQLALAQQDSMRELLDTLSRSDLLRVQRLALDTPDGALMRSRAVESLLGIATEDSECDGEGESREGPTGGGGGIELHSELRASLKRLPPESAALAVAFAASAVLADRLLVVDLGSKIREAQSRALLRRSMFEDEVAAAIASGESATSLAERNLPKNMRSLMVCSECSRVANANCSCAPSAVSDLRSFNEIGHGSSMAMRQDALNGKLAYFCAKRASASVRAAELASQAMEVALRPPSTVIGDVCSTSEQALALALPQAACARLRRDARACMQQRSSSPICGSQPMAVIPLLGRAVRVLNSWWTNCSLCGIVIKWHPGAFFADMPCCMRCDTSVMYSEVDLLPPQVERTMCRFCGKPSDATSGAVHKTYRAPHDVSGANASTPPPLRRVSFCAAHQRAWIGAALQQLPSSQILMHIALAARPTLDALTDDSAARARKTADQPKKRRPSKRRKLLNRRP